MLVAKKETIERQEHITCRALKVAGEGLGAREVYLWSVAHTFWIEAKSQ